VSVLYCFRRFWVGREVSRVSILDSHCVWMLDMVQSDFADLTILTQTNRFASQAPFSLRQASHRQTKPYRLNNSF